MVERQVEADGGQRTRHAPPDLLAWHPQVLAPERDVVSDARKDDLAVRVLQEQPRTAALCGGALTVDQQLTALVALIVAAEHTSHRLEQRGLARSGCPQQQHPLPRLDHQVEVSHRPGVPAGVTPTPAARGDANGWGRIRPVQGQTLSARSRPEAKRLSTPVWAMPRTAIQESRPAMSAPLIMAEMMYTTVNRVSAPAYQAIRSLMAMAIPAPTPARIATPTFQTR